MTDENKPEEAIEPAKTEGSEASTPETAAGESASPADSPAEVVAEAASAAAEGISDNVQAAAGAAVAGTVAAAGDAAASTVQGMADGESVSSVLEEVSSSVEGVSDTIKAAAGAAVAGAVAATAGAAAAAPKPAVSSSDRPVIWSDAGDAPFADGDDDKGPVYSRKGGSTRDRKSKSAAKGAASEFGEILKTVFFALLIALVLRVFLFQPFTIPSASMEPNLYEGDYIIVTKWNYGYSRHAIPFSPRIFEGRIMAQAPKRGDIVVFKLPTDNSTDYIKRVMGLPGDRIQMINNHLYLNGEQVRDTPLSRTEVNDMFGSRSATRLRESLPNGGASFVIQDYGPDGLLDNTEAFVVPEGYYFMMGDNRDNSVDSRVQDGTGVGFVPAENLIGKAEIILFSWSPGASLFNPVSWFSKLRPSRFFTDLD